MSVTVLGIESSCDDTSAAVIRDGVLLSNVIASQDVHAEYGGVVPELASRAHQQNIVPVVDTALKRAGIDKHDLSAIAFTRGPGLLGSLHVGTSFAKGLSLGLRVPIVDVNHLHGHVLSHFIRREENDVVPEYPFLCLLVSGGNSQLILVRNYNDMEILAAPSMMQPARLSTSAPRLWDCLIPEVRISIVLQLRVMPLNSSLPSLISRVWTIVSAD